MRREVTFYKFKLVYYDGYIVVLSNILFSKPKEVEGDESRHVFCPVFSSWLFTRVTLEVDGVDSSLRRIRKRENNKNKGDRWSKDLDKIPFFVK